MLAQTFGQKWNRVLVEAAAGKEKVFDEGKRKWSGDLNLSIDLRHIITFKIICTRAIGKSPLPSCLRILVAKSCHVVSSPLLLKVIFSISPRQQCQSERGRCVTAVTIFIAMSKHP